MATIAFDAQVAYSTITQALAAGLVGAVYGTSDTGFTTALTVTPDGGSPTTSLTSGTNGLIPNLTFDDTQLDPADDPASLVWKSGSHRVTLRSTQYMLDEIQGRLGAATLASDIETAAGTAVASATLTGASQLPGFAGNVTLLESTASRLVNGATPAAGQIIMWAMESGGANPGAIADGDYLLTVDTWTAPALTVVGSGSHTSSASVTSRTVTLPAGIADGDSILFFAAQPTAGATTSPSGISGIVQVAEADQSGHSGYMWVKHSAVSGDSSQVITFTTSSALRVSCAVVVLRGTPGADVVGNYGYAMGSAGTSATTPTQVTTTLAAEFAVILQTGPAVAVTPPDGSWTEIVDIADNNGGGSGVCIAYQSLTSQLAGASFGNDIFTKGSGVGYSAWTIPIKVS